MPNTSFIEYRDGSFPISHFTARKAPLTNLPYAIGNTIEALGWALFYIATGRDNPYLLEIAADAAVTAGRNYGKPIASYCLPQGLRFLAKFRGFKGSRSKTVNVTSTVLNLLDTVADDTNLLGPPKSISHSFQRSVNTLSVITNMAEGYVVKD